MWVAACCASLFAPTGCLRPSRLSAVVHEAAEDTGVGRPFKFLPSVLAVPGGGLAGHALVLC